MNSNAPSAPVPTPAPGYSSVGAYLRALASIFLILLVTFLLYLGFPVRAMYDGVFARILTHCHCSPELVQEIVAHKAFVQFGFDPLHGLGFQILGFFWTRLTYGPIFWFVVLGGVFTAWLHYRDDRR